MPRNFDLVDKHCISPYYLLGCLWSQRIREKVRKSITFQKILAFGLRESLWRWESNFPVSGTHKKTYTPEIFPQREKCEERKGPQGKIFILFSLVPFESMQTLKGKYALYLP